MSSSPASSPDRVHVDRRIWQACAGPAVQIPAVNSRVYYFPQGHLEQSSSPTPPLLSSHILRKPYIACVVAAVSFHADPITDEVFAKLILHPVEATGNFSQPEGRFDAGGPEEEKISSFAKILTASDANNGGGFSVPRLCAESIFPQLDYQSDPPVQTLVVRDIQGVFWNFRHIFRGTPKRHLLTTGWSKFVNNKKLVAGDSVLFMKNSHGDMFVGIRRAARASDVADYGQWRMHIGAVQVKVDGGEPLKEGFSRDGRGRVPAESVINAMEMAARGFPFEVIYYPKIGWSDFVIKADAVEEAMRIYWTPGLRVKMAVETDDASRVTWFQGTVSSTSVPDKGSWQGSPWRMVQVTWDEAEVVGSARCVNPWQVEVMVTPSSPYHSALPPTKRLRSSSVNINPVLGNDGEPEIHFSVSGFAGSTMSGQLDHPLSKYNTFPAGMQGARQDANYASNILQYVSDFSSPNVFAADFIGHTVPKLKTMSTGFNIGSSSENLSPDSMSSGLSSGVELASNRECDTPKVARNSIKLFGETIYLDKPIESVLDEAYCPEDDGIRVTAQVNNPLDLSLTSPYKKLLDDQSLGASVTEACLL